MPTTGGGISYRSNVHFSPSIQIPSGDPSAVKADPQLVAPGTGSNGGVAGPAFGSLDGCKLQSGSPATNAGVAIASHGGIDFWAGTLVGTADVGAHGFRRGRLARGEAVGGPRDPA